MPLAKPPGTLSAAWNSSEAPESPTNAAPASVFAPLLSWLSPPWGDVQNHQRLIRRRSRPLRPCAASHCETLLALRQFAARRFLGHARRPSPPSRLKRCASPWRSVKILRTTLRDVRRENASFRRPRQNPWPPNRCPYQIHTFRLGRTPFRLRGRAPARIPPCRPKSPRFRVGAQDSPAGEKQADRSRSQDRCPRDRIPR